MNGTVTGTDGKLTGIGPVWSQVYLCISLNPPEDAQPAIDARLTAGFLEVLCFGWLNDSAECGGGLIGTMNQKWEVLRS